MPLADLKQQLGQGRLLGSLRRDLAGLQAVRLVREKHGRDSSSLILELLFADGAVSRELVVYAPRPADSGAATRAWWYPADPFVPALERVPGGSLLDEAVWDTPWPPAFDPAAPVTLRRLAYYPGHRASFLLSSPDWPGQLVLKLVQPASFAASLDTAHQLQASALRDRVVLPGLLSVSSSHSALVYEHLPGTGLDQLDRATRGSAQLVAEAGRVLAEIHQVPSPRLPAWDPHAELARTRQLILDADGRPLPGAPAIQPIFERLIGRLSRTGLSSTRLVHNDFCARNVLYHPGGFPGGGPGELAVIDWDQAVVGPVERDIASFLAGFTTDEHATHGWIAAYQRRTGHTVDLGLVQAFRDYQRLLKVCRRVLTDGELSDWSSATLSGIVARLDGSGAP